MSMSTQVSTDSPSSPNSKGTSLTGACSGCNRIGVTLLLCDDFATENSAPTPTNPSLNSKNRYCNQCMLGKKVRVFWPLDEQWYVGVVQRFDSTTGEHLLRYPDGDTEWVKIGDTQQQQQQQQQQAASNTSPPSSQQAPPPDMQSTPQVQSPPRILNKSAVGGSLSGEGSGIPGEGDVYLNGPPGVGYSYHPGSGMQPQNYPPGPYGNGKQQAPYPSNYAMSQQHMNMSPSSSKGSTPGSCSKQPQSSLKNPNSPSNGSSPPSTSPGYNMPPYSAGRHNPYGNMPMAPHAYHTHHMPPGQRGMHPPHPGYHPGYPTPYGHMNHGVNPMGQAMMMGMGAPNGMEGGAGGGQTGSGETKRKSGPKTWTKEEDAILLNMVQSMRMPMKWSVVAQSMPERTGKQCRERYVNHLNPRLKMADWSPNEDATIFHLYNTNGSQWAKMAKMIPGRTDNGIKNRFHNLRRQLEREDEHRMKLSKPHDFPDEIRMERLREFPEKLRGKSDLLWDMCDGIGVLAAQSVLGAGMATRDTVKKKFGPFRQADWKGEQCSRCGLFVPSIQCGTEICDKTLWCESCTRIPPHLSGNLLRECLNLRRSQVKEVDKIASAWSASRDGDNALHDSDRDSESGTQHGNSQNDQTNEEELLNPNTRAHVEMGLVTKGGSTIEV